MGGKMRGKGRNVMVFIMCPYDVITNTMLDR